MEEIFLNINKKDKNAITWIYNKYGKKLYGYAVSKWKLDEDASWELVYKTLYKVIEVVDRYKFENEGKFSAFIFKIFINYLRNHYRDTKEASINTVEISASMERTLSNKDESTEAPTVLRTDRKCLDQELQKLEDWERILVLMRAQDFSYEEIANYVTKPAEQLKVYHMRVKKKITEGTNECIDKNKQ